MKLKTIYLLIAYIALASSIIMITSRGGYGSFIYLSVIFIFAPALLHYIRKHNRRINPDKKDIFDEIDQKTCLVLAILSSIGLIISAVTKYAWIYIVPYVFFLYIYLPRYAPIEQDKMQNQQENEQ